MHVTQTASAKPHTSSTNGYGITTTRGEGEGQGERGPEHATAREWRRPGLWTFREKPPDKKPRTGRFQYSEGKLWRERQGYVGVEGPAIGKTPQGMIGTWVQAKGGNGGSEPARETAEDADTRRGVQGRAAEDGVWRLRENFRWSVLRTWIGGGDWI